MSVLFLVAPPPGRARSLPGGPSAPARAASRARGLLDFSRCTCRAHARATGMAGAQPPSYAASGLSYRALPVRRSLAPWICARLLTPFAFSWA
jgi:hypothetical protein